MLNSRTVEQLTAVERNVFSTAQLFICLPQHAVGRGSTALSAKSRLLGDDADGTGAFFALADLELDRLAFPKLGVALHFYLRVMHEQLRTAVVGDNESKSLFRVKPFYFTRSHC